MRLEKHFERLAEKTGTPELAAVLRGERPATDLPDRCMVWTGAKARANYDYGRLRNMRRAPAMVRDKPRSVMRWEGKTTGVHRVLFELITKPEYLYRMTQQCPTPYCVHPVHWEVHPFTPMGREFSSAPTEIPECPEWDGVWTIDDVERYIDRALLLNNLNTKEKMRDYLAPENFSKPLIDACLLKMNKAHLIW